ncbi:MAG: hypothetical protein M1837_002248 [Sclerophora amabilis]|nr:MAG: hypothetical protein M1837_002248 [Sclerophora amabilis]
MSKETAFGKANREYWDTHASTTFTPEWVKGLTDQITKGLQSRVDWIGFRGVNKSNAPAGRIKMLDYACGSGSASRALRLYVDELRGIDVSGEMVKLYNDAARTHGLSTAQMHAIEGDIMAPLADARDPAIGGPEYRDFDVAVICAGLHHIDKPDVAIKRLVDRLKKGGVLVIIDWTLGDADTHQDALEGGAKGCGHAHQDAPHAAAHTVAFAGFNREQMARMLTEAGCSESDYIELDERSTIPDEIGGSGQIFFARGRKG